MHNRPSVAVGASERLVDIEAADIARANPFTPPPDGPAGATGAEDLDRACEAQMAVVHPRRQLLTRRDIERLFGVGTRYAPPCS